MDPDASSSNPANGVVIVTIRLIRSFEHRNLRNLVLRDVDLDLDVGSFMTLVTSEIAKAANLPPPFRKFDYDCMKIEYQSHGAKTSDPVINREDDDALILRPDVTLRNAGVKHETEVSFFRRQDYEAYKADQQLVW